MESLDLKSSQPLIAPFPWFGGKSRAANLVWSYFGTDVKNYVEPFFGSGAVFLQKPSMVNCWSVVNDIDGLLANFWRAIAHAPETVAFHANNPVNEIDLQARHQWLVDHRNEITQKLKNDPEFFDAKSAGWWAWGCCCWIGRGWCATPKNGNVGKGVNKQIPHLGDGGKGVNKQIPHLGDGGQGVNKQIPHLGDDRLLFLSDWFKKIQIAFRETRVTCGDWQRICTVSTMTRNGLCGVLLDPPYGTTKAVYAKDSDTVAGAVRAWCLENGNNRQLRIALCGHVGQHDELEQIGWTVELPDKYAGYQGADNRERIWFSPHCLKQTDLKGQQLSLLRI
ncbi:MAG: DNA adenine methylase [Microcoleus sp.]